MLSFEGYAGKRNKPGFVRLSGRSVVLKIVVVTPGHPSPRRRSFPPALTAPYIAALATPHAEQIKVFDLAVDTLDLNNPAPDVALFTTTMAQSDQIFEIASAYKARGITTILGGPYATLAGDFDPRISMIFDAVVLGDGEKALPQALEDLRAGALKPSYRQPIDTLAGVPFSRLDLLDHSRYYSSTAVFGTRGCVHNCAYCSVRSLYGRKYLKRPVDEVIEEIKVQTSRPRLPWLDRKLVQFWDDNPACDPDWFHELLEKMVPLKKWWLSQICLNVADSEETVRLMKASGCKGVFVGVESVSDRTLGSLNKDGINARRNYLRQSRTLLRHGINVVAAIMFGCDDDTPEGLFAETPEMLETMGVTLLQDLVFTPYPHLDLFKVLEKEGRIITRESRYYNGYTVVHRPRNIHPAELQERFLGTRRKFYSWRSMARRMSKHRLRALPEFLVWNLLYRTRNYRVIPGVDVDAWLRHLKSL